MTMSTPAFTAVLMSVAERSLRRPIDAVDACQSETTKPSKPSSAFRTSLIRCASVCICMPLTLLKLTITEPTPCSTAATYGARWMSLSCASVSVASPSLTPFCVPPSPR